MSEKYHACRQHEKGDILNEPNVTYTNVLFDLLIDRGMVRFLYMNCTIKASCIGTSSVRTAMLSGSRETAPNHIHTPPDTSCSKYH